MKLFLLALVLAVGASCASKVLVRKNTCKNVFEDIDQCEQVK